MNNNNSVEVVVFRCGANELNLPGLGKEERVWGSPIPYKLSKEGERQAENLRKVIAEKGPFDIIITSDEKRALDTAQIATSELKGVDVKVSKAWREVDLGYFVGKTPKDIKSKYKEYHPDKTVPEDANDCLNEPWPEIEGKEKITFEPYDSEFDQRISNNFYSISKEYRNERVGIITHCEPIRTIVRKSRPSKAFLKTDFGRKILNYSAEANTAKTLGEVIKRAKFKPEYCSWIQLSVDSAGQITIEDSEGVNLNPKFEVLNGLSASAHYNEMWDLCNKVYSEYPYLYTAEGKDDVYKYYLDSFELSQDSTVVLAFDEGTGKLIGMATGIRMNDYAAEHYKKPFSEKNYDLDSVYYVADLLLLPEYRGKGYEQKMYLELENKARCNPQFKKICYATIEEAERTKNLKPDEYCPHAPFWTPFWERLGFIHSDVGFKTKFEILDENEESPHEMIFCIKDL